MGEFREMPQSVKNVTKFARLQHNSHVSFFSDRTSCPGSLVVADWVFSHPASLDFPSRDRLQALRLRGTGHPIISGKTVMAGLNH